MNTPQSVGKTIGIGLLIASGLALGMLAGLVIAFTAGLVPFSIC
jgi:hypothetical protein